MSQKRTLKTIPGFRKSYALVLNGAWEPVDTAVVSVDRFGGTPQSSWPGRFERLATHGGDPHRGIHVWNQQSF
jgi:hypothetical protein